jgi:amino acid transporter
MSLVKALVIVFLILMCFVIALGGGPDHHVSGFYYWQVPGAFAQYSGIEGPKGRFLGVWASIVQATFAYLGTELVGVAFGETPDPRTNVPKAVRQTLLRIVFFYVAGVIVLGMAVPFDSQALKDATSLKSSGGECDRSNRVRKARTYLCIY